MKTIGLLGGMSWESTLSYYAKLNQGIKQQLGGYHSAQIILYSVDFSIIEKHLQAQDWQSITNLLVDAAQKIQAAGADVLLICTNTIHKIANDIENKIDIPLLNIVDTTGQALQHQKITRVGLLGTAFTMEQDFYKRRLSEKYQLQVITPNKEDRTIINEIIFSELCLGKIVEESKKHYLRIIQTLENQGAQAIILGCTEIGLLIQQTDTTIPLFDTTEIHVAAALEFVLQ
ncbi:MAG: aspartate/glutamate racemase family protein [Gammaproteobacteria bacterium]|nr:aspartate/glutamate racemase family protein [Gammaproteobacteria bacterium]